MGFRLFYSDTSFRLGFKRVKKGRTYLIVQMLTPFHQYCILIVSTFLVLSPKMARGSIDHERPHPNAANSNVVIANAYFLFLLHDERAGARAGFVVRDDKTESVREDSPWLENNSPLSLGRKEWGLRYKAQRQLGREAALMIHSLVF